MVRSITKDEVAQHLADAHLQAEPGISTVFRLLAAKRREAAADEPIKLLEVNENTVERGVQPIQFGPHAASGIFYSSIIVDVTPREFELIRKKKLALPDGWRMGPRVAGAKNGVK